MQTCQFCEKFSRSGRTSGRPVTRYSGRVKYGPRHYAHFDCFLNAKGIEGLGLLRAWQIGQFPALLVRERGLDAEFKKAIAKAEGK